MSERYGSWGKVLRVDLTKGTTSVEEMDEATFRRHPGGRALIAHYLLTELPKGAEPLGPENILIFAMGVLTGTALSGASRHAVGAKSPLTGGFGEAEVGGFWGAELKRAGWDAIVVTGASPKPVYLSIKDDPAEISAEALVEKGYRVKMEACWACSVRCKKVVKMETPYQIDPKYGGIEYESIGALGADCGVDDLALISKVNERCNALGLDTISLGATVAWVMDLRARGVLPDAELDGHPVEFGNGKAVLASPDAGAFRRGLGDTLAEGSVRAAQTLGGAEYLTTVRGQELAMHDPRQRTEYGKQVRISYATSPTGGDHMNSNLPSRSAKNTVGMCFFLRYDDPKLTDILNAVTGWGLDAAGLTRIGELSLTMARLFNNREGFAAGDDKLPEQVMKPHVSGVLSRVRLDADDIAEQVRAYYRSRGWSDDGVPKPETLERLGLSEYARA